MRSLRRVLGVGVLVVALSACWPTPGAGPSRRSFNPFERDLTPTSVGRLTEAFRVPLTGTGGPPVVTPAGLFVRSGLDVVALDPGTGARRWTTRVPEAPPEFDEFLTISDPHVVDSDELIATETIYGASGVITVYLVTIAIDTGAVLGREYVTGALGSLRGRSAGLIVREICCEGTFDFTRIGVTDLDGGPAWGGTALEATGGTLSQGDGRLFVTTRNQVQAYDTTTPCPLRDGGPLRWCPSLWARPLDAPASPVVIGDDATLYVVSGGLLFALNADTGGIRWLSDPFVGYGLTQSPALADGVLHVASTDGRLWAFPADGCGDAFFCPASWGTQAGPTVSVQPAVGGGVVYTGAADGTLKAFAAAGCGGDSCPPLWTADAGSGVTGGLAIHNGHLYAGTADSTVGYGLPPT
jgi:outer membrane protein assembly factor BamB